MNHEAIPPFANKQEEAAWWDNPPESQPSDSVLRGNKALFAGSAKPICPVHRRPSQFASRMRK